MSSKLRVTLCQMAVGTDKTNNLAKAVRMIEEATKRGSSFVVLPECFNSPYGTNYFPTYAEVLEPGNPTYDAMSNAARSNGVWLVAGSVPEKGESGEFFNSSMTFAPDGCLKHVHRKVHLFRINTEKVKMDEGEVLTAGNKASVVEIENGLKVGVGICFDIRFPQFACKLASQGSSILVFPSAFNMVTGPLHWELAGRSRATDNQQYVLLCSPARDTSAGYVAWGHSMVIDPMGKVVAEADEKEGFVDAELDVNLIISTRAQIPILSGTRADLYSINWGGEP